MVCGVCVCVCVCMMCGVCVRGVCVCVCVCVVCVCVHEYASKARALQPSSCTPNKTSATAE